MVASDVLVFLNAALFHCAAHLLTKVILPGTLRGEEATKGSHGRSDLGDQKALVHSSAANRAHNIVAHLLYSVQHLYLLFWDPDVAADRVRGYCTRGHYTFLLTAGFYTYDTLFMWWAMLSARKVQGENPPGLRVGGLLAGWTAHHVVTVGFLLFVTRVYRGGVFTVSIFLLSAAGHIPNEARWFVLRRYEVSGREAPALVVDAVNVTGLLVFFVAGIVLPVWMLIAMGDQIAREENADGVRSLAERWLAGARGMKTGCIVGWLGIFVPHVLLVGMLVARVCRDWGGERGRRMAAKKD